MSNGPTPPSALRTVTGASRRNAAKIESNRIGRYFVLERLGQGGMGVVYSAYDPELDRRVAIKLLHSPKDGRSPLRLIREGQAMARLSHPNVVQVYDVGTSDEQIYIAMELVVGQNVRAWLRAGRKSLRQILRVFVDAGRGLSAAHAEGLVHRDFKPDNVLMGTDGRVRVADFGIASWDAPEQPPSSPPGAASFLHAQITVTGAVVGTPRYMAPEQHAGLPVGPAADQFSFCVALHEALFDERPFAGDTLAELADNVTSERYQPPRDPSRAPKWIVDVVRQGLRADPQLRYPSIDALIDRLTDDPSARRRRRIRNGVAALVLGSSVTAAAWTWTAYAERACASGEASIASLWNDERRASVAERFATGGESGAVEAGAAVQRTVDSYAASWVAAHHGMCVAHRDGTVSDDLLDVSMACLDRRRGALDRLLDIVDDASGSTLVNTTTAAAKLPRIDDCVDRHALAQEVPPPDDPARAAAVNELRRRLATAKVTHDAGDVTTAIAELAAIADETDAVAYDPLTAEAGLAIGRLAMDRRAWDDARGELQRASSRGIASGMDVVAAEAEARLIYVDAMASEQPASALEREPLALALIERVGDPGWLRALMSNNVGAVHGMLGDRDRAESWFAKAFEHAERFGGVDPIDHSGYAINLARLTRDPERRDELFARAQALVGDALGPDHFEYLDQAIGRAKHLVDPADAVEHLAPVCRQLASRRGDDVMRCYSCFWREAELHDETSDVAAAIVAARSAASCIAPAHGPLVEALRAKMSAHVAVLQHDPETALGSLAEAERLLEPKRELPWIALELADLTLLRARALDQLGRRAEVADALLGAWATYEHQIEAYEDRAAHYRSAQARALLQPL